MAIANPFSTIILVSCFLTIFVYFDYCVFKGSLDPSHKSIIFEIDVGKSRIRHTTTLKLNDEFRDRLQIDLR